MVDAGPALGLWGLFVSAFISSTIAPGGSEGVLAWLVSQTAISKTSLVATATVGNTLGAMTTWLLGSLAARGYPVERFFSNYSLDSLHRVRKWGAPILFFSWLPVVGDAFCFAAGWLRLSLLPSIAMIVTGKCLRYVVIVSIIR